MHTKLNISIAMTTYNGELFLLQQLDSFSSQTFLPFELIVCDDGSRDGTIGLLNDFADKAPFPVHICINEHNLGYTKNFMKCAYLCKGDWIAFADQDDVWLPEKLMKISQTIENNKHLNLLMTSHSAQVVDEDLVPTEIRSPDFKNDQIIGPNMCFLFLRLRGCTLTFSSKLLQYAALDSTPMYDRHKQAVSPEHDHWFCLLASAVGYTALIADTLSLYRRHNSNTTDFSTKKISLMNRISQTMKLQNTDFIGYATHMRKYGEYFHELSLLHNHESGLFNAAANNMIHLSRIYTCRSEIYDSKSFFKQLLMFLRIIFYRGYVGPPSYALGLAALIKDLSFVCGLWHRK